MHKTPKSSSNSRESGHYNAVAWRWALLILRVCDAVKLCHTSIYIINNRASIFHISPIAPFGRMCISMCARMCEWSCIGMSAYALFSLYIFLGDCKWRPPPSYHTKSKHWNVDGITIDAILIACRLFWCLCIQRQKMEQTKNELSNIAQDDFALIFVWNW